MKNKYMNEDPEYIGDQIVLLERKLLDIDHQSARENRPLNQAEVDLRAAIVDTIKDMRLSLPAKTLTVQGFGGTSQSSQVGNRQVSSLRTGGSGRSYQAMFNKDNNRSLDSGGFNSFNEFLSLVHSGRSDSRLLLDVIQNSMNETTPSSGGFSVPAEFAAWLLDSSLETEIIRPRATVWPMTSDTRKVPGWDSKSHTAGLFGGLTGVWLDELGAATEVFAKLRMIELKTKKLACYTSASNELLADGLSFEEQLAVALVKTLSFYLDYAFISGTGAGQPQGLLKSPALITISKESGQLSSTIVYENITKMYARLAPQCMANAVWIASQTTVPQMLALSITTGLSGVPYPALKESNGQFSLLGKPVFFTEKVPALGSLGDLILCDPSQYAIGMRKEISMDKSIHPGWLTDSSAYRVICRADGQGMWDAAITPKNGDTLSWCVTLQART